jgi:hypothetical protein
MWSERARGSRVAGSCLLGHPDLEHKFKLAEERERERQQGRRRVDSHLGMV